MQLALGVSAVNQPERYRYAGSRGPALVVLPGRRRAEFFFLFGLSLGLSSSFGSGLGLPGLAFGCFLLPLFSAPARSAFCVRFGSSSLALKSLRGLLD